MRCLTTAAAIAALMVGALGLGAGPAAAAPPGKIKNVVLVHGAWADGSGWQGVYDILTKDGYHVSVVSNPDSSIADDAAATKRVIDRQDGPVILVGHSYGGAVITQAGDDPKVAALVYIAAFAPDVGELVLGMIPKGAPPLPVTVTGGFAYLNHDAFLAAFAPDVPEPERSFMADSQTPLGLAAGSTPLTVAAWKTKPSWYMVSTHDQMIPPDAERAMAARMKAVTRELDGGHVAFIVQPIPVAALIEDAAAKVGR